jgi:segregation and condensation protein A
MEEAEKEAEKIEAKAEITQKPEHPANTQFYNIVVGKDASWQSIIYELVASEQMDPWNIDIATLCRSYFERIKVLEESNFHVSSKMLLAASILLRIKSEILLHKYIREIDNVLFPREDEIRKIIERIEINEDEVPILSPKTPLPRFKKVTLQELIDALDTAIKTESRRIDKEIQKKQAERLSHVDIPKFKRINIQERIRRFYAKVLSGFKNKKGEVKLSYSHFVGNNKEERIACFLPMLYLSNNGKVWIEQEAHFKEIYLYLMEVFRKTFPDYEKSLMDEAENLEEIPEHLMEKMEEYEEELEEAVEKAGKKLEMPESEKQKRVEKINTDSEKSDDSSDPSKSKRYKPEDFAGFENPLGDLID